MNLLKDISIEVVIIISLILMATMAAICVVVIMYRSWVTDNKLKKFKEKIEELEKRSKELDEELKQNSIEYSHKVMEYLRAIISQVCLLKFKTFEDGHDMDMVTKANIEGLIKDVCDTVHSSINVSNLMFDNMLFTEKFFDNYIIETSIIVIKEMLEKIQSEK